MVNRNGGRQLSYQDAISEALVEAMTRDPKMFLFGIGVDDPKGIFGTTTAASKKFGPKRVFDTPVSENALTGLAVGAALNGHRSILVHARNDFMYYSFDQLFNHAAKWFHMFGGRMRVPIIIRAIVGRGWGQGPQHSQSLQAVFGHIPGFRVALPATPHDAKGVYLAALKETSPIVVIEHRRLYDLKGDVPKGFYATPAGKGSVAREGKHATVVAVSYMRPLVMEAADRLKKDGVEIEVIDPLWIKPLDEALILKSVRKTGRLVVCDTAWKSYGVSAEIAALAAEKAWASLKAPIQRVACPDFPAPTSRALEPHYYASVDDVITAVQRAVGISRRPSRNGARTSTDRYIGAF